MQFWAAIIQEFPMQILTLPVNPIQLFDIALQNQSLSNCAVQPRYSEGEQVHMRTCLRFRNTHTNYQGGVEPWVQTERRWVLWDFSSFFLIIYCEKNEFSIQTKVSLVISIIHYVPSVHMVCVWVWWKMEVGRQSVVG